MSYSHTKEDQAGWMQTAREKLCLAQTWAPDHWRGDLQTALNIIDLYGSTLPGWSKHNQPEYPEPKS